MRINFTLPISKGLYGNTLKFGYKYTVKKKERNTEYYDYSDAADKYIPDWKNNLVSEVRDGFMPGSQYPIGTQFVSKDYIGKINFDKADGVEVYEEEAGNMRVRFTTSHPKDMSDDTLHAIAEVPNICKQIHLPVQSGSDKILKLMNRKYTRAWYMDRVKAIRDIVPECGLTTDIFVGYHNETEEDHQLSLSLMEEVGYDSAFMFKYSERPGTYASKHLPDNVPEEVKLRRLKELIDLQTRLSAEANRRDEDKVFDVLIENFSKRSKEQLCGRTEQGKMVVFDKGCHHIGETVKVRIDGSSSATLFGEVESLTPYPSPKGEGR